MAKEEKRKKKCGQNCFNQLSTQSHHASASAAVATAAEHCFVLVALATDRKCNHRFLGYVAKTLKR